MTENAIKILNYLKEHPNATREEIEKALDISPKLIKIYVSTSISMPKISLEEVSV